MNKSYINAIALRTVCGNTEETFNYVFNKKTALKKFDNIIPDKVVCIGQFLSNYSFNDLLDLSVNEILETSNLSNFSNTLLLVGSSVGGMSNSEKVLFRDKKYNNIDINSHTIDVIASTLNKKYKFLSTRSFSTACTSSTNALKVAKELISFGAYKNILVIGADEICLTTIFGFNSLGILNDDVSTPFQNNRKGMNVSEGIGVLLLQDIKTKDSIELIGAGSSSDAFHIANPDPHAEGAKQAILEAVNNAKINIEDIDYINAHGTGTNANDAAESKAILELFDKNVPVSSSKSNFGHTLGASGAIEAVICVESLKKGLVPPQIKSDDNEFDLNIQSEVEEKKLTYILSNSFAFGGNNTSLIFGKVE